MKTIVKSENSFLPLRKILVLFIACLFSGSGIFAQNSGEAIFKANCSACHSPAAKKMTGPGLRGATKRRSGEWLLNWVKNSQGLIQAGDADAAAIFKEYNNMPMPPMALGDEDIKSVFTYIDELEKKDLEKEAAKRKADSLAALSVPAPGGATKADAPFTLPSYWKFFIVGTVLIFGLGFLFLSYVNRILVNTTGKGLPFVDTTEGGFYDKLIDENRKLFIAIAIIVILVAIRGCYTMLPV